MSQEKTARLLDLVAYLSSCRAPVSRRELSEKIKGYRTRLDSGADSESVRKMFARDQEDLRSWGIDISRVELPHEESSDPQFGYLLEENHVYLPYVLLDGDESKARSPYRSLSAVSLNDTDLRILDRATKRLAARKELPMARSVKSLRRKFEFDIPLSPEVIETTLASPSTGNVSASLDVLQRGIAGGKAVSVEYHSIARDETLLRVIEPYGLFLNWGKWYCVARPEEKEGEQVFRVDRMSNAKLMKDRGFFVPDDFSVSVYTGRPPWVLSDGPGTQVGVRFPFPESRWIMRRGLGDVVEAVDDDGGALLRFEVRSKNPFLRWLLSFQGRAVVESPASFVTDLEAIRNKIRALYRDDADG